jgi:CubicO group peptidase (beta-lactamase class C family)
VATLAAATAAGQAPSTSAIDTAIESAQRRLKIPGLAVAAVMDGKIVYDRAFGLADIENGVAATTATRFRTASLAKPLTATGVMVLAERGQLDLDAPIEKYCAAFPQKEHAVTARLLLGHLAGVRHYGRPGESLGTQHYFAVADSLALFKDDPLLHRPGDTYLYSTFGYSVLGCAIEGASGHTYRAFMQEHVMKPAGMAHTTIDELYLILPNRARGYQLLTEEGFRSLPPAAQAIARPNEIYNAPLHDTSMKVPGGGWLTTAADMVRFADALMSGRIVQPATLAQMWTSLKTPDGQETGYGLGFGVSNANGTLAISHTGNQAGAASVLRISPARKAAVVVLGNLEDAPVSDVANAIVPLLNSLGR